MSHLRFVPIVVGALALASSGVAAQQAPVPKPFASLKCTYNWCVDMPRTSPNGRFVAQGGPAGLTMHEVASGKSWVLSEGEAEEVSWSPRGDMLTFGRDADDGSTYIWSVRVEPATGKAGGPAQRVSLGAGSNPSISPDSRWIVFTAEDSINSSIAVVSATGGPVRVLVPGKGTLEPQWSADGKTIYVVDWQSKANADVLKLSVATGKTTMLYKGGGTIAGMSTDRRYLVLVPVIYSADRSKPGEQGTVIDTAGHVVGHFPLPTGEKQFDRILGDSAIIWLSVTDRRMLEVRPLAGGAAKRLPVVGESNEIPRWSPDGKRIAFMVRDANGRSKIAVSNADGSNPKVFGEISVRGALWSPDSRFIAEVNQHRLFTIDVTTGAERTVLDNSTVVGGNTHWLKDQKGIVMMYRTGLTATWYQVSLAGQVTKQMELPWPANASGSFLGDSAWFMRTDSGAFIHSLGSHPIRQIGAVPLQTHVTNPSISLRLGLFAAELLVPKRTGNSQVEVIALATGARSVLDLPFILAGHMTFVPGDSALLAIGRTGATSPLDVSGGRADSVLRIYRVPLNGGKPHVVGDLGMMQRWQGTPFTISVSPDGKSVLYDSQPENSTMTLSLHRLAGAIPAANRRP